MPPGHLVNLSLSNACVRQALVLSSLLWMAMPAGAVELRVSPAPPAHPDGSSDQPFASIPAALQKVRELRRLGRIPTDEPAKIMLQGGLYPLSGPLIFSARDSGTESSPTMIEAAPGEHPVLSGGVAIKGWQRLTGDLSGLPEIARRNVWVAEAPRDRGRVLEFRQLWLNGSKAVRAREPNPDHLARLLGWDKARQTATIPAALLKGISQPDRLEMVVDQVWETASLRVNTVRLLGTNDLLTFKQPESSLEFEHPWPPVTVNAKYQAPFYLVNALPFLDAPGEWYEDLSAGKIYYWPRPGEDLTRAQAIAPALETLVQVEGSLDHPATHLCFKGIAFAYATWLRPSAQGHVPLQAGMFLLDAHRLSPKGTSYHPKLDNVAWIGRPPAAIRLNCAANVAFEDCTFEHLASAGLDAGTGCHAVLVQGCAFRDIGGNGLQLGMFSDPKVETHIPYDPGDDREICTDIHLRNNVITECGTEDWGCVGIAAGYVRTTSMEHNEISNLPYSGISLGWGWTKMTNAMRDNAIVANHIHHAGLRLGDLGGIYLLSAQPGTVVSGNSIEDMPPSAWVPDPEHWFYLYTDEGSAGITVRDNWCPAPKFLKNANGPGNTWLNNGPAVSEQIKNAAGLEPDFQYLLK
jgi:hypothetical protein